VAVLLVTCPVFSGDSGPPIRNVILMVADGAGFNTWKAAEMYRGSTGREFYDEPGWKRCAVSTHALRRLAEVPVSARHATTQVPSFVYDPMRVWDFTPVAGGPDRYPHFFAGYRWLRETAPDSANTATALFAGVKTYVGAINVDGAGEPLEATLPALARRVGKKVGVVTDVPFVHATPAAAAGAHHVNRRAYCPLAIEILTSRGLDVIAGGTDPDFDHNGERLGDGATKSYQSVGGKPVWDLLTGSGSPKPGDRPCAEESEPSSTGVEIVLDRGQIDALREWTLVRAKSEIESLTDGATPARLLLIPQVGSQSFPSGRPTESGEPGTTSVGGALQQQRGSRADPRTTPPGYDPRTETVPSLATLTRVALNALDDDPEGFFLHVEGGSIDWAMHQNQIGRMIEETLAFREAVLAVTDWIDRRRAWDETLVVIVADHDHMLWGPNSDSVPFAPLRDNGKGEVPSYRWLSNGHSNSLVPLFARGAGAELFSTRADREDPFYGPYIDQTDVYSVIAALLDHE
jgi:alkaline phosphatase